MSKRLGFSSTNHRQNVSHFLCDKEKNNHKIHSSPNHFEWRVPLQPGQPDLKTFSILGCYELTVLTSFPVQDSQSVKKVYDIPISAIQEQIETIADDIEIDAIKNWDAS
jgi:hypothetical protein